MAAGWFSVLLPLAGFGIVRELRGANTTDWGFF